MNTRLDVSICIVNWNTCDVLRNCLKSIFDKTKGLTFEVIIVDNDSHDDSCEMIEREFPESKLIAVKRNLGFSKANNVALKEAKGKYVFFLNPDTELKTNAILGMYTYSENNNEYGAVGCKLLLKDGSIQYICARSFPTPLKQFLYLTMLDRVFTKSNFFSTVEMLHWNHLTSRDVDCLSGACIFSPKTLLDKLHGFDELFFMYAEDVDLCYRIRQKGNNIHYLAEEEIYHYHGSASIKRDDKFFSAILQRESNIYFLAKHFGAFTAAQFRIAVLSGSIIRMIIIITLLPFLIVCRNNMTVSMIYALKKYFNLFLWSIRCRRVHSST